MRKTTTIPLEAGSPWHVLLSIPDTEGAVCRITAQEMEVLRVSFLEETLTADLQFDRNRPPMALTAPANPGDTAVLACFGTRIALFVNKKLADEEWPLGSLFEGEADFIAPPDTQFNPTAFCAPTRKLESGFCAEGWRPNEPGVNVGDCMPFYDNGTLHVFYLRDRHHHKSRWGLGAHQWAHISTQDLIHWQEHPLAIACDGADEGSICTGSVMMCQNRYFAHYAVRSCDGSPGRVTWAVSDDGIHFQKSGTSVILPPYYDTPSARDPKVFQDDTGRYHMLVTTSLADENRGCLARLSSADLVHWTDEGPFVVMEDERQPECCDVFFWKGYYYLVYSLDLTARYYRSKAPFGPWEAPEGNVIAYPYPDDKAEKQLRVPKACLWVDGCAERKAPADSTSRLIFCGFIEEGKGYGGTMHFCEAVQEEGGRLRFEPVPEMTEGIR